MEACSTADLHDHEDIQFTNHPLMMVAHVILQRPPLHQNPPPPPPSFCNKVYVHLITSKCLIQSAQDIWHFKLEDWEEENLMVNWTEKAMLEQQNPCQCRWVSAALQGTYRISQFLTEEFS